MKSTADGAEIREMGNVQEKMISQLEIDVLIKKKRDHVSNRYKFLVNS